MKVIFFGTPQFAAQTLNDLLKAGINVVAIVSKPDRPKGRSGTPVSTPVKLIAQSCAPHIPLYQPEVASDLTFAETLKQYDADLFIVVAYGEIVKQHLLDMPRLGCINVHASVLPKYRGAAPIQRCLINGETESGVTIMHLVKKMDAGDMIKIVSTPIESNTTAGELEQILQKIGSNALLEVLIEFEQGIIRRIPQDHSQVTYASKIEFEDCQINWEFPAKNIHNLVRGVNPEPGAWCLIKIRGEKKRLKIYRTVVNESLSGKPGEILLFNKEGFVVACGQQALNIQELQMESKKTMMVSEFVRGLQLNHILFI
jgi:methionyl-tRNA formyltransferase